LIYQEKELSKQNSLIMLFMQIYFASSYTQAP